MRRFLSILLAVIMTASSAVFVYAGSNNTLGSSAIPEALPNSVIINDTNFYQTLSIRPRNSIESGDSIILNLNENARFVREFVESDIINLSDAGDVKGIDDGIENPFIFRAKEGGETYSEIFANKLDNDYETLKYYVGDRGSNELPYGFRWVNENELEVKLFPIPDNYVNQNNSDITKGVPEYNIALPVAATDKLGEAVVTIDDNGSSVTGGQSLVICNVVEEYSDGRDKPITDYSPIINHYAERVVNAEPGEAIKYNGAPNALYITPTGDVYEDGSVLITIRNGSFDENLLEECQFKAENGGETWDYIVNNQSKSLFDTIKYYVGDRKSRCLPYNIEYIDSETIKVSLFPFPELYANQNNEDITFGVPVYKILLPAVAGSDLGVTEVAVDGRKANIRNGGWYTIANVGAHSEEYAINSNIYTEREISVDANQTIMYNGQPNAVYIDPTLGVSSGDTILIKVQNGSFDESLVESCQFKCQNGGETWDYIINNKLESDYDTIKHYVGDRMSRQLPYNIEYVSSDTIKVELYPIDDFYVTAKSYSPDNSIVRGNPVYRVQLPLISGSESGYTKIAVDGQQSTIKSGGWYTVARINKDIYYSETIAGAGSLSINSVNTVKRGAVVKNGNNNPPILSITPRAEISKGDAVYVTINNGSFDEKLIDDYKFIAERGGETWDYIIENQMESNYATVKHYVGDRWSRQLPYNIEYINTSTIKIELFPIEDCYVDINNSDITLGTPVYLIKLPATAGNEAGDITISIDGNGTIVPNRTNLRIASVTDPSTTAFVYLGDVVETSDYVVNVPDITIRENVAGTFTDGTIVVKPDDNFKFAAGSADAKVIYATNAVGESLCASLTEDEIIFNIDTTTFDETKIVSVIITGLNLQPKDSSYTGDVYINVSGTAGITDNTIKVASKLKSEIVKGDVNSDGEVNGKDVILLRQYLAGWESANLLPEQTDAGDVNSDGETNGKDIIVIRQYLAGWDIVF